MFVQNFLALAVAATAALAAPTAQKLEPWQITSLGTYSPSGRPGDQPYSFVNVTITDPNTIDTFESPSGQAVIPPSTAQCYVRWNGTVPWGASQKCESDSPYSTWSFKLEKPPKDPKFPASGTENFKLAFELNDQQTVISHKYNKTFVGSDHFKAGHKLVGNCGGSGTCAWNLRKSPELVHQRVKK